MHNCQGYSPPLFHFHFQVFQDYQELSINKQTCILKKCDAFMWSYNLKKRNNVVHSATIRSSVYEDLILSETEKATIEELYTINSQICQYTLD